MDRHLVPRVADRIGHLFVEHARVERDDGALVITDDGGRTSMPAAPLSLLLLGPGTTITHAAILLAAEVDLFVVWVGEGTERFYAAGSPDRRSTKLLGQARAWADPVSRLAVVRRMYAQRFGTDPAAADTIEVLRGREGLRVRAAYVDAAGRVGITWTGRHTRTGSWAQVDTANRALSSASTAIYGVVHAAIVAAGYSAAIGFIHTGSTRSFVFDIADLYKSELTIPAAFYTAAEGSQDIERRTRMACRRAFYEAGLFERIIPDIESLLELSGTPEALPHLWTPGEPDP